MLKKLAITGLFIIILLIIFFSFYKFILTDGTDPIETIVYEKPIEKLEEEIIIEPIVKITEAKLSAVGDVLIHSSVYKDAHVSGNKYDFRKMFSSVKKYIESSDIAIANSETMIGGVEIGLSDYPNFNSPKEVGDMLKWSGFDIVTLANNHTLDRGLRGVTAGLENWDKIGLVKTGAARSFKEQNKIATFKTNDITFSTLSYTYGTNGIAVPYGKEYVVNVFDKKQMSRDIKKAKAVSDVVIVAMHWGNEYETVPNKQQKVWAKWLADQGVHIILGSHPHVLQPPAWVTGKNGFQTYVIYSMGNYISAQEGVSRLIGGIFGLTIEKRMVDQKVTITLKDPNVLPTYNSYVKFRNYNVYPLRTVSKKKLPKRDQHYKETVNHLKKYLGDELLIQK